MSLGMIQADSKASQESWFMWLSRYIVSSVGRKQVMGVTGLVWYLFLFVHLAGNMALLSGPERFNSYGFLLVDTLGEVIIPCEIFFLVCLVVHVFLSIQLALENRAARPRRYVKYASAARAKGRRGGEPGAAPYGATFGASIASQSMLYGGIGMALFLGIHVLSFRFGIATANQMSTVGGMEMRDLYAMVMATFKQPLYTAGYVVAIILVAAHLWHGVQSSVQSVGLNHAKYVPFVRAFSRLYAVLIGGGFSALAVWSFLQGAGA
jgi:succinate dehydrogenase / fumarate reductase, cytochrome b subunit